MANASMYDERGTALVAPALPLYARGDVGLEVIGRDEELAVVGAVLERGMSRAAGCLIEGELGVGKTTVWTAALEDASGRGYRVVSSRPAEVETSFAFAAIGDLLRENLDAVLRALPQPQRRALEAALLVADETVTPGRHAVSVAVLGALVSLAAERPLVVGVDDAQWLDSPSRTVLEFVARRLSSHPVVLLLAERVERDGSPTLELGLPRDRIELGPLSPGSLHRLLHDRLDVTLSRPLLLRLHETSGGNPFYALELARALLSSGGAAAPNEPLPVPGKLRELVGRRLAALSRSTRDALLAAAASARPTRALLPREALDEALDADVLALHGDHVRFTHPLLASVLYSNAARSDRRAAHRRLAGLLTDPEEAARHLALATSDPEKTVAVRIERAARRARARGALAAAAELMEQAVALTPPSGVDDRVRRVLAAGQLHVDAGTGGANSVVESVLPLTRGDTRARALRLLALDRRERGRFGEDIPLLREALAHIETDAVLEAQIRVELINPLFNMAAECMEDADANAERAVLIAERAADPGLLSSALAARAQLDFARRRRVRTADFERAAEMERGAEQAGMTARLTLARLRIWIGRIDEARTGLMPLYQEARAAGLRSEFWALSFLVDAETRGGNLARARELADEFEAIRHQAPRALTDVVALVSEGLISAWTGEVDRARREADEAIRLADAGGWPPRVVESRWVRGLVELSLGDAAAAHEYFEPAVDRVWKGGVGGASRHVPLFRDDAEALAELGKPDDVSRLIAWLERDVESPWASAAAAHSRGVAADAVGDHERGAAALEDAVETFARLPLPLDLARALLALGSAQRRVRRKHDARMSLERALEIFDERGAGLWAEQARRELARIGGRAPADSDLTASERRVAELVAEGLTNKEVAQRLFITDRTVEGHLTHIYAKLGVRSRAELARRFSLTV